MAEALREFQVFVKPAGAACNLGCRYCYYLEKKHLYGDDGPVRMSDDLLEAYIVQHIAAHPGPVIHFSWHGGEPTILGLDYFQKIAALQKKHRPAGRRITNGIQTNGILLNTAWCRFLKSADFSVGISLDGPEEIHDRYRVTPTGEPTHARVMRGYRLLNEHRIAVDILCVVNAHNVRYPAQVYRFFKQIGAEYLGFIPLVTPLPDAGGVDSRSVPAEAFGDFLCTIFDEWVNRDIGRIKVQIFEEAVRTAFGQEHSLCIFRKTCGDVPVVECNGDFYSCDHFVTPAHRLGNIRETSLARLLNSPAQRAFGRAKWDRLPADCLRCEVLEMCNGGCPKDRILQTPDGEDGLSYLCAGYRRFFTRCRPFVAEIAALRRSRTRAQNPRDTPARAGSKTGRNDPCPCGSGKKYKKCCGGA